MSERHEGRRKGRSLCPLKSLFPCDRLLLLLQPLCLSSDLSRPLDDAALLLVDGGGVSLRVRRSGNVLDAEGLDDGKVKLDVLASQILEDPVALAGEDGGLSLGREIVTEAVAVVKDRVETLLHDGGCKCDRISGSEDQRSKIKDQEKEKEKGKEKEKERE